MYLLINGYSKTSAVLRLSFYHSGLDKGNNHKELIQYVISFFQTQWQLKLLILCFEALWEVNTSNDACCSSRDDEN